MDLSYEWKEQKKLTNVKILRASEKSLYYYNNNNYFISSYRSCTIVTDLGKNTRQSDIFIHLYISFSLFDRYGQLKGPGI